MAAQRGEAAAEICAAGVQEGWCKSLCAPIAFRLDRIGECSLLAEVYTRGAKMWFLSQAEFLEVMEPADFRQEMQETISRMLGNYQEQVQLP